MAGTFTTKDGKHSFASSDAGMSMGEMKAAAMDAMSGSADEAAFKRMMGEPLTPDSEKKMRAMMNAAGMDAADIDATFAAMKAG